MKHRHLLNLAGLVLAGVLSSALAGPSARAEPQNELRVGYQKNGILVIARQQGILERRLAKQNATVKWGRIPVWTAIARGARRGEHRYRTDGGMRLRFSPRPRVPTLFMSPVSR